MPNRSEADYLLQIADREDLPSTWRQLRSLAETDQAVFERLADYLEDDMLMRNAAQHALAEIGGSDAVTVELPLHAIGKRKGSAHRWFAVSGWLSAAAMCLAWLTSSPTETRSTTDQPGNHSRTDPASVVATRTVEPKSELIRELPKILVRSDPTANGDAIDVLFVRQTLERSRLNHLTALRFDDAGTGWRTNLRPAQFSSPETF